MNIKEFRQYYLNKYEMTDFMNKYKGKTVHLCEDYDEIIDEFIKCGWCKYDSDIDCYYLENDLNCDYHFDFADKSFVMDLYEIDTLAVFKKDSDYCVPLYCIQEAWDYMKENKKEENEETEVGIASDKSLPLKMLTNLEMLKDVVNLKKKANLNDDDTLKMLELLFK